MTNQNPCPGRME